MDHESFIYLQRYNVPREIDNLCQNILEKNPRNLHTFISRWAQGRTTGYRGGVAFLIVTELATNEEVSTNVVAAQHHAHHINTVKRGTPTSRATLVMLDEDGNPLATVPNITFYQEEGRSMLGHSDSAAVHCPLVSVPEEWAVCLCVPTGPQCCEIRKYSTAGQLLWTTTVDRAVSAMARDSLTGKLWVSYSGGSGAIYRAHHKAESLPSMPHVYSMSSVSCHRAVFFLTGPTVERRCLDTTSLIFVVHFDQWEGISSRYLPLLIQAGAETTWVVFTRRHAGLASLEKDPFPVQTNTVADSTKRGLAVKGGVPSMGLYHPSQTFAFETNTGTFLHPFEPHALSVQYRAACAHDTLRGGLWILVDDCRVQYYTTKGAQTVSFRVHSGINIAIGVDAKLGHVWLLNLAALSHRPRIYCFDPMAQSVHAQMDLQRTFPDMVRKCPAALRYSNTANAMEQGNFSECSNQMLQNQDSQKMQILVVVCPL